MNNSFLPGRIYKFLFALLGLVYVAGLFVPLMDTDSAHHANIALHMYLTGDYVSLVDQAGDYLDKPHLLFWLCAASYKIFGVTTFAYKFPSLLFTVLGVYSTYRLGKALYDRETGRLAALILASAFAFILANNDVRMDSILTACIVLATWQLVEYIQAGAFRNLAGAALGLALGFSTKGHIAVFVPAVAALFYILYKKDWKQFLNPRWLILLGLFGLFIAPVVYCYYLQFNLHPEKIVRGKDHINGVRFILLNQSVERFSGEMGHDSKHDYFFFLHSFLWAFAPWCILAYLAIAGSIRDFLKRKEEWLSPGIFLVMVIVVSLSGFKLPHYLNVVFPSTSILVAAFVLQKKENLKWIKTIFIIQGVLVILLLLFSAIINGWAFPVTSTWVIAGVVILLSVVFYFFKSPVYGRLQKAVAVSVAAMVLSFFLLNSNFYPQLLHYQGGKPLADLARGKIKPDQVYFWKNTFSSSFNFYTRSLYKLFSDPVLQPGRKTWLIYDVRDEETIKQAGYHTERMFAVLDFGITKLDIKFINPATREERCSKMVLAEISR